MNVLDTEDKKDSIITIKDFPFICRICSLRRNYLRLFKEEGYLWDLFLTITNIDVDAASLFPKNICDECINKLQDILVFIDTSKSKYSTSAENLIPKGEIECSEAVTGGVSCEDGVNEEYQICRICSCRSNLTHLTEKINLMQIFQNLTKIDVKSEINSANGNLICNACIGKLENIASFTELTLCNERKFQYCISLNEAVKTESYSNLTGITDNDTILNNIHDGHEEKHEIIDIKNEDFLSIPNGFKSETTIDGTNGENYINVKEEIIYSDSEEKLHLYISTDEKPFKCNQCKESFVQRALLNRHMVIHSGEKPFKCDYCDKGFARKDNLRRHSLTHNNIQDKPHKCDCCEKSFSRIQYLNRHLLAHIRKKSFNCEFCGECFPREDDLQRHLIIHSTAATIDGPKKEIVDTDAESLPKRIHQNGLESHLQPFPDEPSIKKFKTFSQTENEESPHSCIGTDEKLFSCDQCKKSFAEQSSLSDHLLVHTRERPFSCNSCDRSFTLKRSLRRHLLTHTTEKPFKCDCCDRSFFDSSALKMHLRTHTTEKPFKCDCCHRSFIERSALERHFRTHTEEKPYTCERCGRKFPRNNQLQRHMLTHSGDKPFKCNFCVKSFNESSDLKRHLRLHTGEKPFKCQHCDERFIRNDHLQRHSLNHATKKPFECNICDKSFTLRHHLQQHLLIHTKEKPHRCDTCGRSFPRKHHLQRHVLTHTRGTLLKCDHCDKFFAGNSYLQEHLLTHVIENQ